MALVYKHESVAKVQINLYWLRMFVSNTCKVKLVEMGSNCRHLFLQELLALRSPLAYPSDTGFLFDMSTLYTFGCEIGLLLKIDWGRVFGL